MPLSKPQPRKHIHTRHIHCRGFHREDGLWDIEGWFADTKTYSFDNEDRGGIRSGESIHEMGVRLTVDDDLVVVAAEVAIEAAPFSLCGDIASSYAALKGMRIGPGWRKALAQRFGAVKGCSHITDLLVGPLTATAFQTVTTARHSRETVTDQETRPALLDTCHALAGDSAVTKRMWPALYTGK